MIHCLHKRSHVKESFCISVGTHTQKKREINIFGARQDIEVI